MFYPPKPPRPTNRRQLYSRPPSSVQKIHPQVHYTSSTVIPPSGCSVFYVLCNSFHCRNFSKLNSPTCNCNDTVVNWFIKEKSCITCTCMVYVYQNNKSPLKKSVHLTHTFICVFQLFLTMNSIPLAVLSRRIYLSEENTMCCLWGKFTWTHTNTHTHIYI
jgi:hypothetical protein